MDAIARHQQEQANHPLVVAAMRSSALLEPKQRLLRAGWKRLREGGDGLGWWQKKDLRMIHSFGVVEHDLWSHMSMSVKGMAGLPTWEQMRDTWWILHPSTFAVIVIAPQSTHVNLGEVHHAWGNLSRPAVPDFTHGLGSI